MLFEIKEEKCGLKILIPMGMGITPQLFHSRWKCWNEKVKKAFVFFFCDDQENVFIEK